MIGLRRQVTGRLVVADYEEDRKDALADNGNAEAVAELLAVRVVLDEQFDALGVPS